MGSGGCDRRAVTHTCATNRGTVRVSGGEEGDASNPNGSRTGHAYHDGSENERKPAHHAIVAPASLRRDSRTLARRMSTPRLNDGFERRRCVGEWLPGVQRVDVPVVGFAPLEDEMIPELTTMEEWWSEKRARRHRPPHVTGPKLTAIRRSSSSRESEGAEVGPERPGCSNGSLRSTWPPPTVMCALPGGACPGTPRSRSNSASDSLSERWER